MEVTTEKEAMKRNALNMALDHRKNCTPNCTISLFWLRRLLDIAGIELTAEEKEAFL